MNSRSRHLPLSLAAILFCMAFNLVNTSQAIAQSNPFLNRYTAKFGIPPFDRIQTKHYVPAFEKGMADHLKEIDEIANNSEPATFENTIVALDETGKLLDKVANVFFNLSSSNTNEEIQKIQLEISPQLSAHEDKILLNEKLFKRVNKVWEARKATGYQQEAFRLLEETFKQFKRGGALLSEEDKEKVTKINSEIATLSVKFGQNLLDETNAYKMFIADKKELDGLPDAIISAAADAATEAGEEGKWLFTPHRSSMYPFLTYSTNRKRREEIYNAYVMRGDNGNDEDNKQIVARLASLRFQRAQLLGYPTHAHYILEEHMAKEPAKVYELLMKLWKPALARAKQEVADMQEIADSEGGDFKIAGCDWWHYAEKVRAKKYALDEEDLKPYFSLKATQQGAFAVANRLFGVTFTEMDGVELYHPDAQVFEVKNSDGSHLGVFIADYYTRKSKRGGAWMSNFRDQSNLKEQVRPIVVNVCNFAPPVGDQPSLLTFEQVTTLFHEFGHALHGLLTNTKYQSLSGTNVPRDFVEFPAQILEHWASEPSVLKEYALHYKTGEPIPDELIKKIQNASKFNQGFANTEYLAASLLDMDWHTLDTAEVQDTAEFEKKSLAKIGLIDEIESRYRSTYFSHIFAGGYSSGYYSYIWSAVLDSDGFSAFKESGDLFNPDLASKYRRFVLEAGGTYEAMDAYKSFRGSEPKIEPLLRKRGLDGSGSGK